MREEPCESVQHAAAGSRCQCSHRRVRGDDGKARLQQIKQDGPCALDGCDLSVHG